MNVERWQRIKGIFATLLELSPEEGAGRLGATVPDAPSLAAEVEEPPAALDSDDDVAEPGAPAAGPPRPRPLLGVVPGMRLGPYRVVRELGRGGMGAVYLAERDEPGFSQQVAIKLVKRGMDTDEIVRRFRAERQILASLSHPHIARLLDGGTAPDGRPYFVMEYIEGQPITAFAGERKLDVEARLRLFLKVAAAVQSAHQSLVVHRDLKPANILVDAAGEPKLLDFGIAKLLDPTGVRTSLTGLRRGPMTPDYASPEQRAGTPITTATDVYGLGLLLYELLAGLSPAAADRRLGKGWGGRPPSQVVKELAKPEEGDQRRLARRLEGDLDTIVGKALAAEPERRYGTVDAFAEDVLRHLTQRPVTARRPTLAYRLGRTMVRHKLAAALALGLVVLAGVSLYLAVVALQERDRAERERQGAEATSTFLSELIERTHSTASGAAILRPVLDAEARKLRERAARDPSIAQAPLLGTVGNVYGNLGFPAEAKDFLGDALKRRQKQGDSGREADLVLAANLTALADAERNLESYDDSREHYERALALKRRRLRSNELPLEKEWNGLGLVALEQKKYDEAREDFGHALTISRLAGKTGERSLAITRNNLGQLEAAQEHYDQARQLFESSYRSHRAIGGDDDLDTLDMENNLAYSLFQLEEYAQAEPLYQDVARKRLKRLGAAHPGYANALLNLAIVQKRLARFQEARAILDQIFELRRAYGLPHDAGEAELWNLLGGVCLGQKDLTVAEGAYGQSYALYRALAGDHRADLANVLTGQAQVRLGQGDLAGALELVSRSLALRPDFAEARRLRETLLRQGARPGPRWVPRPVASGSTLKGGISP